MARYIKEYRQKEDPQVSFQAISQYLISRGFEYTNYNGENLFKKGNGWMTAPSFVKISYGPGTVRFEAWIKYAVLPGVFAGEFGYKGVMGWAVKENIKSAGTWVDQILGGPAYALTVGEDAKPGRALTPVAYVVPPQPQPQPQQPVLVPTGVWYCPKCGTRADPQRPFCVKCGTRVC